jgi:hypothetical protein
VRIGRLAAVFAVYVVIAVVVAAPVAAERAVEGVGFDDRLGSLPVRVSLAHNGVTTLDTGIAGQIYWDRTGAAGFGAHLRVTGPPEAGGTLSSYVNPKFVEANARFLSDPGDVARAYGNRLRDELLADFIGYQLWCGLVGGILLTVVFRGHMPLLRMRRRSRLLLTAGGVMLALGVSGLTAAGLFRQWEQTTAVEQAYPMPGIDRLSFSSPQALEVARQVQPFIEKNRTRIRERATAFEDRAVAALIETLPRHADALAPRVGEVVVLAEADPQGALVGTRVRAQLYPLLTSLLGDDAIAARTISGDVTSNGTVAEEGFVEGEAEASPEVPLAAAKGDHDSQTTLDQLADHDVLLPHLDPVDINGVHVVSADDPAFKTLFGGLVSNDTGTTEAELGQHLRDAVDPEGSGQVEPLVVLVHQPRAAAGYIGIEALTDLAHATRWNTAPREDGIADLPPGLVNVGHLHDAAGPWVVWNTDTDQTTWTVVAQLGTSGGVEENPTINRFSTPFSAPLKAVSVQLQYLDAETGLATGYASIDIETDGTVTVTDRVDLGLPEADDTALP